MAQTHLSYSDFASIYGDLGVTEWTKYNWLADYWKELTPDGYERVQWLQSDGNQYIQTTKSFERGFELETEIVPDVDISQASPLRILDCWDSQGSRNFFLITTVSHPDHPKQFLLGYGDGMSDFTYFGSITSGETYHIKCSNVKGNRYAIVNDTSYTLSDGDSDVYSSTTAAILGRNPKYVGKISYLYVWDHNGDLAFYFIPMVRTSDNKPGLYDLVNHQFYTNQGLLDFLAGPPVGYTQVEYLESNGNQWIDLGIKGNLYTSLEYKIKQLDETSLNTISFAGDGTVSDKAITTNFSTSESGRNSRFGDKVITVANIPINTNLEVSIDSTQLKINGATIGTFNTTTSFETTNNMKLFRVGGIDSAGYYDCTTDCYWVKVKQFADVTLHLLPALDPQNRPCMYDLISRTPFYNQGTGEFTWG